MAEINSVNTLDFPILRCYRLRRSLFSAFIVRFERPMINFRERAQQIRLSDDFLSGSSFSANNLLLKTVFSLPFGLAVTPTRHSEN